MKAKLTRRKLMAAAVATAPVACDALASRTLAAQTAPQQQDLASAAREANQRNGDVLTKFEIPLTTEPAFRFKA